MTKDKQPSTKKSVDVKKDKELQSSAPQEIGGRKGLDPTRYGDWEKNGKCVDF